MDSAFCTASTSTLGVRIDSFPELATDEDGVERGEDNDFGIAEGLGASIVDVANVELVGLVVVTAELDGPILAAVGLTGILATDLRS